MNKDIVVAGATGEVGRRLVEKLIVQNPNSQIHVLVRAPSNLFSEEVIQHVINFDELDNFKLQQTFGIAYCCLGTTIKLAGSQAAFRHVDHDYVLAFAKWVQAHGCTRFASISAVGAKQSSGNFYLSVKGETESDLTHLNWKRLWLIRPSLLLGPRTEFRAGEYIGSILSRFISPFLFGPLIKYKPIAMIQVAQAMSALAQLTDDKDGCEVLQGKRLFKA